MKKRKTTKKTQKKRNRPVSRAVRERDPIPWKYCFLTLVCGSFLVVGFLGAARQHFASIDYGIKNSKLRKQLSELETEKRRLLLAREVALSPVEIKKAARRIGLVERGAGPVFVRLKESPSGNSRRAARPGTAAPDSQKTGGRAAEPASKPAVPKNIGYPDQNRRDGKNRSRRAGTDQKKGKTKAKKTRQDGAAEPGKKITRNRVVSSAKD